MSRILLDTSAYVAFMSGHPRAVDAVREAEEVFLSATVLGELLAGFADMVRVSLFIVCFVCLRWPPIERPDYEKHVSGPDFPGVRA